MIAKTEYSVGSIARLFGVANETVKRWIRAGKLKGEYEARRYGYVIKAEDLENFIASDPKYQRWMNLDGDRAFVNFCKEMLIDIYRIEAKNLGQEHGKVWNEGFEAALKEVELALKDKISSYDIPAVGKSKHYSQA